MRKPKIENLSNEGGQYLVNLKCDECNHTRRCYPHTLAAIGGGWETKLDDAPPRPSPQRSLLSPAGAWRMDIIRLANGLRHTMNVAAECFERIAPTRKICRDDQPPELFSEVLRAKWNARG